MTLRAKQSLFVRLIAELIKEACSRGYELTLGDAYRSAEEATRLGFPRSLHTERLAIDFNLFQNGRYLTSTKAWTGLGEWWESQHELCRWGGRFGDGNHFSLTHGGRK